MEIKNTAPMLRIIRRHWVEDTAENIARRFQMKFHRGIQEHGNDLGYVTTEQLINEMEAEALDQLAYVAELRRRITPLTKQKPS